LTIISKDRLQGKAIFVWGGMHLQLHPVAALAPLGGSLAQPGPLDVGIFLVAHAPNHTVVVHRVDYGRLSLRGLAPGNGLKEEGIFIASLLGQ